MSTPARGYSYTTTILRIPPDLPLALMDMAIGLCLIIGPSNRNSAPSFNTAKELAPIQVWGAVFVAVGFILFLSLRWHNYNWMTNVIRILGPSLFVMWGCMYLLSGLVFTKASFVGVAPFLYLGYRHTFAPAARTR